MALPESAQALQAPGRLGLARARATETARAPRRLLSAQPSPLQLQFVMSPSDICAAYASFQLLLSQDGAMLPRTHPHALPFLNGLQLHLTHATRLPKYADVQCFTDEVSMSLHACGAACAACFATCSSACSTALEESSHVFGLQI